jgi:hypothetical protein
MSELSFSSLGGRLELPALHRFPANAQRNTSESVLVQAAIARLGLRPLALSEADIFRKPRFAISRMVWTSVRHPDQISVWMQVSKVST